jgi:ribosomal protein L31E
MDKIIFKNIKTEKVICSKEICAYIHKTSIKRKCSPKKLKISRENTA